MKVEELVSQAVTVSQAIDELAILIGRKRPIDDAERDRLRAVVVKANAALAGMMSLAGSIA